MATSVDPGTPSSRASSITPRKMGAQQYYPGFSPPRDSPGRHVRSLKFGSREGRASERHPARRGIEARNSGKLSDSDDEKPPVMVRSRTGTGFNITSPKHQDKDPSPRLTPKREYGSHGSIDMLTSGSERDNFYAFLREFGAGSVSSQEDRSREPSHDSRAVAKSVQLFSVTSHSKSEEVVEELNCPPSPKPKSKFKFFDGKTSKKVKVKDVNSVTSRSTSEPSIFKKLRPGKNSAGCVPLSSVEVVEPKGFSALNGYDSDVESRLEDKLRRKAFGHHDCQSLAANLSYVAQLRSILSQRRNTTTGASAASQATKGQSSPQDPNGAENNNDVPQSSEEKDSGDGKSNRILLSCPYFRNEFGGEEEWSIALTRSNLEKISKHKRRSLTGSPGKSVCPIPEVLLRPSCTYGLSVLEYSARGSHWAHGICPYQRQPTTVENFDAGARYYSTHFYGQEHQNWFGMDENLGPVAISLKRERLGDDPVEQNGDQLTNNSQPLRHLYRLIVRTSELFAMRGTILEDAIPSLKPANAGTKDKGIQPKELLEFVAPEVQLSCLRLATPGQSTEDQLLKLDHQGLSNHYKVGILYCKAGQSTEEEMYNNEEGGPAFNEFLDLIGKRVRLKGFEKYKAGLDNKMDSTGQYSVYAEHQGCEIMFHVSTLLPFTPNNRQQLLRKRHIGNDIVTIVFQEPGARAFTPKNIRSQFQHVFIVVRAINAGQEGTKYAVAVTRSREVPAFGPALPEGGIFVKSRPFVDFLLAKVINAENAAHRSEKFATMATRTRQEYLKDLTTNYVTSQTLELGSKFPVLTFTSRKKERLKPRFHPDAAQRGAIVWQVAVDDSGHARTVECLLGISTDTLVVIEECTKEPIFCLPCKSILGWTTSTNSARIYYHRGESITVHIRDMEADEIPEIAARLAAVSNGCETRELTLKRNSLGQLGFHVHPDGNVTEVEGRGAAWKAGLRPGSRIVEICKIAVSTLSHEQMVDLLKTSVTVTVTVIPALNDGTPRKGCSSSSCPYIQFEEGDYENLNGNANEGAVVPPNLKRGDDTHQVAQQQKATTRRWERSVSPPRSSNSSGYGTGSSSRSCQKRFVISPSADPTGTLTSTSTEFSNEDRWFDFESEQTPDDSPPPPLPIRNKSEMAKLRQSLKLTNNYVNHIYGEIQNDCQEIQCSDVEPEIMSKKCIPDSLAREGVQLSFENKKSSRSREAIFKNVPLEVKELPGTCRPTQPPEYSIAVLERMTAAKMNGHVSKTTDPMAPESILDRLSASRSEDELSSGSNGLSPRSRRRFRNGLNSLAQNVGGPSVTPTPSLSSNGSGGGRNDSPRGSAEARLRPAAAVRSGCSSYRKSAQSTGGNLQEELLRLIDPEEYRTEQKWDEGYSRFKEPNEPVSIISIQSAPGQYRKTPAKDPRNAYGGLKFRPGDRMSYALPNKQVPTNQNVVLARKARTMPPNMSPKMFADAKDVLNTTGESLDSDGEEIGSGPNESVILTHARPATVISNASSTPSLNDSGHSRDGGASPRTHRHIRSPPGSSAVTPPVPLPPNQAIDWSVLVNTARSIQGTSGQSLERLNDPPSSMETIGTSSVELRRDYDNAVSPISDASAGSSFEVEKQVSELRTHVNSLESRLRSEEVRRTTLEDQVKRLQDENRRLQVESHSASEQLKKFTDWFFQTIDRP